MEKIKISIDKGVLALLKKDCLDFCVLKANGEINVNAFCNILIANYYENFAAVEESLYDDIRDALQNVPTYYKDDAFDKIVKIITKREMQDDKKQNVVFSFKPSKVGEKAINYIDNILLKSESISSFYRRLFTSYSQKPKNEREKIICKQNYELLSKAINKSAQVLITLKSGDVIKEASVYTIGSSKDELFNYVLVYCKNNVTLRLAKIESVNVLNTKASIPKENEDLFAKQVACAIQYPMYNTDDEPVKVQLTKEGKKLFEKIYLYRPEPIEIDGDIYTFNCSKNQLLYYFERFGDRAIILSPKKHGIFMRNYYWYAYKKYNSLYKRDN